MLEVAEAAGDAAAEFDDPVDGLGTTVARAVGVEVGQERGLQRLRVFPSLAISGIGQVGSEAMSFSASWRPRAGVGWWNTSRRS